MLPKIIFKYWKLRWSLLWTVLIICQLYDNGIFAAPTKHVQITAKGDTSRLRVIPAKDIVTVPKGLDVAKWKNYRTKTTFPLSISTTTNIFEVLLKNETDNPETSCEPDLEKNELTTTAKTLLHTLLFNKNSQEVPKIKQNINALSEASKTTDTLIEKISLPARRKKILQTEKTKDKIKIKNEIKNISGEIMHHTSTTTGKMPTKVSQILQQQRAEPLGSPGENMEASKKYISIGMPIAKTKFSIAISTQGPVTMGTDVSSFDKFNDKMILSYRQNIPYRLPVKNFDKHLNVNNTVTTAIYKEKEHVAILTSSAIISQPKAYSNESKMEIISTPTTSTSSTIVTSQAPSTLSSMDVMFQHQGWMSDMAVKLLELEERKSFTLERKHHSIQGSDDVADFDFDGHDGIKNTKKKQLKCDKHVIDAIAMNVTQLPISLENFKTKKHFSERETSANKTKQPGNNNKNAILLPEISYSTTQSLRPIHTDARVYNVKETLPITNPKTSRTIPLPTTLPYLLTQNDDSLTEDSTNYLTDQTESKISDIQVEIYDSTVDSVLTAATHNSVQASTTKSPPIFLPQQKFTQYVVDRVDSSTQKSSLLDPIVGDFGKPEPAAIEIHINVSEGIENGIENLEFSYPQTSSKTSAAPLKTFWKQSFRPFNHSEVFKSNKTKDTFNADELLVVQIIDKDYNSTDYSASAKNIHPMLTFRTDQNVKEIDKDNTTVASTTSNVQHADELFIAEVKPEISVAPPIVQSSVIDHDSNTIFYISNTEVKVGKSPESDSLTIKQNSILNAPYKVSTHPNESKADAKRYEENILLSSIQNTADSLKIYRHQNEEDTPSLDVTYVGESIMEVEQLSPEDKEKNEISMSQETKTTSTLAPSHLLIQPASLLEIGVPVIGELPPQIELKEFDFMPDEFRNHEQRSGSVTGVEEENVHLEESQTLVGNQVGLVESSIQYGGDLINEGAVDIGIGFNGAEGSYPFGNLATMGRHGKQNSKRKHGVDLSMNIGINNFRKNELSVDINGRNTAEISALANENSTPLKSTLKDTMENIRAASNTNMNVTFPVAQRMTNATLASFMKHPRPGSLYARDEYYLGIISNIIIATLPVITSYAFFCTVRYFYHKYSYVKENDSTNVTTHVKINGNDKHCASAGNSQDISRKARDTKMHYNNSTGKDRIFFVEVSRGAESQRTQPSFLFENAITLTQYATTTNASASAAEPFLLLEKSIKSPTIHEEVQVHKPQSEIEEKKKLNRFLAGEEKIEILHSNTGLSQSDLSSSSASDSNKAYKYGNQSLYAVDDSSLLEQDNSKLIKSLNEIHLTSETGIGENFREGENQAIKKAKIEPQENIAGDILVEPEFESVISFPAPPSYEDPTNLDSLPPPL